MSSPLSMLKKRKRVPLQDPLQEQRDRQKVAFRRNLLKEVQEGQTDESSDPRPPLTSHAPASHGSTAKSDIHLKTATPPNDFELLSAMMKRVTLLEKTVRSQRQEIECKDKRIQALEEKLQRQKESEIIHDMSGRDDLKRRCQQLQNQVREMESFLNDYGLIWVGNGESSGSAKMKQPHDTGRDSWPPVGNFHMNFDLVLQRIKELNFLAGEGECFVRSTVTGAQLAKKDPIRLSLYSNGIVMFDGPFRSYQEHSTQQCMQDLMDGYFPSELQERFPDGVPFEVYDRREEEFILRVPWNTFPGEGRAVGGEKNEAAKKLSVDQFLNKLPKVVVQAGRVIDVRDSLRCVLQGPSIGQNSSSAVPIETAALQTMKRRLQTNSPDRPASAHDVINLKVKSEDGNQTFKLKMYLSETIGHVRQYVDKHRGGCHSGYDIISAYPQCCYDDSQMLQSCGLITNVTLVLRKREQPNSLTACNKINL